MLGVARNAMRAPAHPAQQSRLALHHPSKRSTWRRRGSAQGTACTSPYQPPPSLSGELPPKRWFRLSAGVAADCRCAAGLPQGHPPMPTCSPPVGAGAGRLGGPRDPLAACTEHAGGVRSPPTRYLSGGLLGDCCSTPSPSRRPPRTDRAREADSAVTLSHEPTADGGGGRAAGHPH